MPELTPNSLLIKRAINGPKAVYAITKHARLYLDVLGNGRAAWRLRYRPQPKASQRWYTLAKDASAVDFYAVARKAKELLAALDLEGIDPHDQRRTTVAEELTVADAFAKWLDHTGKRRTKALAPRTRTGYESLYALHVSRTLGSVALTQLDRATIAHAVEAARVNTSDGKKGQRGIQSTKVLKLLSSLCEWAIDQGILTLNPCRGIAYPVPVKNPQGKQARPPTDLELRQLWRDAPFLLSAAQMRVLKLAILTGRRISEITGAMRDEAKIDDPIPYLFIPAHREGNKAKRADVVPLAPIALTVVKDAIAASKSGEPLFVGAATRWTTSKALTMLRRVWMWPEPPVRFHDFRSLINDQMSKLGVPTEIRSRTLHHTGDLQQLANTVYSAYDFLDERLRALELWEGRLIEIVEERPAAGKRWSH